MQRYGVLRIASRLCSGRPWYNTFLYADKKSAGSKKEKKEKKDKREKKDRDKHRESKKARHQSREAEAAGTSTAEPSARISDPQMYAPLSKWL